MKYSIDHYNTLVFDCDGVILNSNKIKTHAFYLAALPYGEGAAQAMIAYHVANGGLSRYHKFAYFLDEIVRSKASDYELQILLDTYASYVRDELLYCEIAPGLNELREHSKHSRWLIVSGGDQIELNDVFAVRGLTEFFDGGIFGSPDTKDDILSRECQSGHVRQPALFLGDSKYDYQAADRAGLDFIFLSDWTDIENWKIWCEKYKIKNLANISKISAYIPN
ncbi:MAG: HAD family hydrolase [Pseudomonadota bacterium]